MKEKDDMVYWSQCGACGKVKNFPEATSREHLQELGLKWAADHLTKKHNVDIRKMKIQKIVL